MPILHSMTLINPAQAVRREARIRFGHAEFEVIQTGDFVNCAATGKAIAVSELRYWDVARQQAFCAAEVAFAQFIASNQP